MPKRLPRPDGHNHLLATLPPEDRARLQPHLTEVALDLGMVIEEPGQPIGQVVFPLSGVMSIIVSGARKERRIEAGLFGCDGMTGTAILSVARLASWHSKARLVAPPCGSVQPGTNPEAGTLRHKAGSAGRGQGIGPAERRQPRCPTCGGTGIPRRFR